MFEQLKARFCCFKEDYQINISIELMNCKGFAKSQKSYALSETQKLKNKISPSREILVDFSDYSFYLMIAFNGGEMDYSTDFLYIRDENQTIPQKIEEIVVNSAYNLEILDNFSIPISENSFNLHQSCAHFSLASLDPRKT